MKKLRVLILAPDCNPESISTPQIAYAHAEALARQHTVTLVVRAANESPIHRAHGPFKEVCPIALPGIDHLYRWALKYVFKYDYGRQSLTAATYPLQVAFEWRAWQHLQAPLRGGEFDVVLRLLPIVTVLPSPFAFFLRNGSVPFVIGPLNGGLPWPDGFPQLDSQRKQAGYWVSRLRGLYRYLPFARSTYRDASAIIAGSSHTYSEFAQFRRKLFFVPGENGLDPDLLRRGEAGRAPSGATIRLMFVGRLIPLKACDLALQAAAELLRSGEANFTIIGDGADRERLQKLCITLGISKSVTFTGWLPWPEALAQLGQADILVFPSLREFGGAVVFEALALGAVPVVADFGGPGDIITPDVGYKIALTNEIDFIKDLRAALNRLAHDREHLSILRRQGMAYANDQLTWDGKARAVSRVLNWVTGNGEKPDMPPPQSPKMAKR